MKQEDLDKLKPRGKDVNDILRSKRGGRHDPKTGDNIKRSRQKEQTRKLIESVD